MLLLSLGNRITKRKCSVIQYVMRCSSILIYTAYLMSVGDMLGSNNGMLIMHQHTGMWPRKYVLLAIMLCIQLV